MQKFILAEPPTVPEAPQAPLEVSETDGFTKQDRAALLATFNLPKLASYLYPEVRALGGDPDDDAYWEKTCAVIVRLSKADYDGRTPDGPENQFRVCGRFLAFHRIRPVEVLVELNSAYTMKRSNAKRTRFWSLVERIRENEIDIDAVVVYHQDRFFRDVQLGSRAMADLRDHLAFNDSGKPVPRSIGLYAAKDGDDIRRRLRSLHDPAEWGEWLKELQYAQQQSEATSRRIHDNFMGKLQRGEMPTPIQRVFGYRPVYGVRVKRTRNGPEEIPFQRAAELDPVEAPLLKDAIKVLLAGTATVPEIVREWKACGLTWRDAEVTTRKLWEAITHPRIAGLLVCGRDPENENSDLLYPASMIPALASVEDWQRLRELREASNLKKSGTGARALLCDGLAVCGVCGGNLWMFKRGEKGAYYRCGHRKAPGKHASPPAHVLEGFVLSVTDWAYREHQRALAEDKTAEQRALDVQRDIADIDEKLAALQQEIEVINRNERKRVYTEHQADAERAEVEAERQPLMARRSELVSKQTTRNRYAIDATEVHEILLNGKPEAKRRVIRAVIDHVVVHLPAHQPGLKRAYELAFEVVWADGVHLPEDVVETIARKLMLDRRMTRKINENLKLISQLAEDTIMELWQERRWSFPEIAEELDRRHIKPPRSDKWSAGSLRLIVQRLCRARAIDYETYRPVEISSELLNFIYEQRQSGASVQDVADLLNDTQRRAPSGRPWQDYMVSYFYSEARRRRGEEMPVGRPELLAASVRKRMIAMKQSGMSHRAIARWLNEEMGLRRASGKLWDSQSVAHQFRRWDVVYA